MHWRRSGSAKERSSVVQTLLRRRRELRAVGGLEERGRKSTACWRRPRAGKETAAATGRTDEAALHVEARRAGCEKKRRFFEPLQPLAGICSSLL